MRRRYERERRKTIKLPNGQVLPVEEGCGRGNKHVNVRRDGAPCGNPGCKERWAPICPNTACAGNRVPREMIRRERYGPRRHERR